MASVCGPAPASQMTLALQVPRFGSEGLTVVPWVRPLVPLLKEELRATGRSGSSWRCHCRHFFWTSSCTWPQKSAISPGENIKDRYPESCSLPWGLRPGPAFLPSGHAFPSPAGHSD